MKILSSKDFASLYEKLDIRPITKDMLSDMSDERILREKMHARKDTKEYAEFIWYTYAKIQKRIIEGDYKVEVSGKLTLKGELGYAHSQENIWIVELPLRTSNVYKIKDLTDYECSPYWPKPPYHIWITSAENAYSDEVKKDVWKKLGMELKPIYELVADKNGLYNKKIADAITLKFNKVNWGINAHQELIDGLENAIGDVNVKLQYMTRGLGDDTIEPFVYICLNKNEKGIDRHSSNVFWFDLSYGKIECRNMPHLYLSPFDKSGKNTFNPSLRYLAMRSSDNLLKECGMKTWRKVSYKNTQDIINKISRYVNDSIRLMDIYCGTNVKLLGGKDMIGVLDISIADANMKNI